MALKDYVDKIYTHTTLGTVKVLKVVPKSRTKLVVKLLDHGAGYDHDRKRYTGVHKKGGWMRGQNYQRGHVDEVHRKDLKKCDYQYD